MSDFLVRALLAILICSRTYYHKGISRLQSIDGSVTEVSAHSGFLGGAKALLSLVLRHISSIQGEGKIRHIVFAGHSAGGAVASLLHFKVLFDYATLGRSFQAKSARICLHLSCYILSSNFLVSRSALLPSSALIFTEA